MIEHQPVLSPTLPYIVRVGHHLVEEQVNEMRKWCRLHAGQEGTFHEAYGEYREDGSSKRDVFADHGGCWFVAAVMSNQVWRFRNYDVAFAFTMRWS